MVNHRNSALQRVPLPGIEDKQFQHNLQIAHEPVEFYKYEKYLRLLNRKYKQRPCDQILCLMCMYMRKHMHVLISSTSGKSNAL